MFKLDDSFQIPQNTRHDGLLMLITPIKILVVDNKRDLLTYDVEELQSYSFEVTFVDHSGAALRLLTEKNKQYDLLLIDSGITGVDIHTFLRVTKNMDILSIVMSEQEDDAFIHEAFQSGAFLVIKRPLTMDALRRIRQDVIRQRTHKQEKCKSQNMVTKNERQSSEVPKKRNSSITKNGRCQRKKRVLQSSDDDDNDNDDDHDDDINIKQKICLEWTKELHEKFLNVLSQLGEGRCFPKKILELMNVPGLTRMQVASHLQNYQKGKQKSNKKKTALPSSFLPGKHNAKELGNDLSNNGWQTQINYMNNQTYRISSTMNMSNEKSIAQQTEYTQIPYRGNQELNHDDIFGKTITTNDYFPQTISGFRDFGQGYINQDVSFLPRQASQEFPIFIRDLDGNGPNGF